MYDIADIAGLVEERKERIPEEPEQSPWSGMELPAIFAHLIGQGEDPETAGDIVDGIMAERMKDNGNGHTA